MSSRKLVIAAASTLIAVSAGAALTYYVTRPAPEPDVPPVPYRETSPQNDRDLERYADMSSLKLALSAYFADKGTYPETLAGLAPNHIGEVPTDPKVDEPYRYEMVNGAYVITFELEKGVLSFSPGVHTLTPGGFDVPPVRPEVVASGENTVIVAPDESITAAPQEIGTPSPFPDVPAADTDNDSIPDDVETMLFGTDPLKTDTDGDGFGDIDEIRAGYDPTAKEGKLADTDGDGLADQYETYIGTRADLFDTDGDGAGDGAEVLLATTDPLAKN